MANRRRADERDSRHIRVSQQHVHDAFRPVDQIHDSRREIHLVQYLEEDLLGDGALL